MLDSFSPLVPLSIDMYLPAFPQIAATSGRVGPLAVDPVDLHDRVGVAGMKTSQTRLQIAGNFQTDTLTSARGEVELGDVRFQIE